MGEGGGTGVSVGYGTGRNGVNEGHEGHCGGGAVHALGLLYWEMNE